MPDEFIPPTDEEMSELLPAPFAYTPAERRFTTLTAREFCALPEPDTSDNLLGPLLRRNQRTIIGGHTGEGKSCFVAGMLNAFLAKDEFLGFTGTGGHALVIDLEQGRRSIKRMLRQAGLQDRDDLDILAVPDGLDLDKDEAQRAEIEQLIRDGNYDIVALDPYYKAHTGDSNDERQTDTLMRIFDHWRALYGFCLTMPAHCRKPNPAMPNAFSIHDIFGSSAFLRGAEVVLGIRRIKDGYSKLHFFKDRDGELPLAPTTWGLFFSVDDGFRRDENYGVERDYLAELLAFMVPGRWYSLNELKAPKDPKDPTTKRGIGARKEAILPVLDGNPDTFETGDKTAAGRSQAGNYYRIPGEGGTVSPDPGDTLFELKTGQGVTEPPVTARTQGVTVSPPYIGDTLRPCHLADDAPDAVLCACGWPLPDGGAGACANPVHAGDDAERIDAIDQQRTHEYTEGR